MEYLDQIKLGFGNNLVMGWVPPGLDLDKVSNKLKSEHNDDIESFGLFDTSQPNYTNYYPDVKAEDLTPKDSEFIEPLFRALSEVIVHKDWNPVDFSANSVLKNSMGLLKGATVNPDHESRIVGNALGAVSKVGWQESYKTDKGIIVPAGINANLKIDGKSNPRIARAIMMDPPSIHSTSVTVQFLWDKSHASLSDEEFFKKLGTYDKDGKMIRRMATKVKKYPEISLVHHGADPFAQKTDENGKIINPMYADTSYNSEQLISFRKNQKHFFFDFKTDLIANEEKNTIPIDSNDNKTILNMDFLKQLALALGLPADKHTEEAVLAAITAAATQATTLQASLDSATATNTTNATEITRLKVLETELTTLKASNPTAESLAALKTFQETTITNKRNLVTAIYNKTSSGKPVAGITAMIGAADMAALEALEIQYNTELEAMYPSSCKKCGSKDITKASAVIKKEPGSEDEAFTELSFEDASDSLMKRHHKKNSLPMVGVASAKA